MSDRARLPEAGHFATEGTNAPVRKLSPIARASRLAEPSARFLETSENSGSWYASCFACPQLECALDAQESSRLQLEEDRDMPSKGDERMGRRAQRTSCSLLFVLLAVALAPTLAGAQTQTPWKDQLVVVPDTADMTLYEATENMRFLGRALLSGQSGKRKATSELMGVARRNTPLCPPLDPATDATNPCVVNATGTSDVDLTTGRGNIVG